METPRPPAPRGEGSLFRKPGSLIWTMQLYVPVRQAPQALDAHHR
jgi:hypothetical protein